jgi:hypothetical protein
MGCSCIKGSYDFVVTEINCDKVLYQDLSVWMEGENYTLPPTYKLDIYDIDNQGTTTTLLQTIDVNTKGITDIAKYVKDGVYEFRVVSCENTYKRWVGIAPKLQCCLDRYLASSEYDEKKYTEADRLLKGVRTTALFNQPAEAIAFYKMAKRLVDKLNCDC